MPDRPRKPQSGSSVAPKLCATCGRTMDYRKKWAANWDAVKYCSDACRTHKPAAQDAALEAAILQLLAQRGRDKTICPSEAAKLVGGNADRSQWEPLMEPARAAARRLVAQDRIVIQQHGNVVDGSTATGPIRLKLK